MNILVCDEEYVSMVGERICSREKLHGILENKF